MAQIMANSFSLRVLRNDGSSDGDGQKHMHPQSPLNTVRLHWLIKIIDPSAIKTNFASKWKKRNRFSVL